MDCFSLSPICVLEDNVFYTYLIYDMSNKYSELTSIKPNLKNCLAYSRIEYYSSDFAFGLYYHTLYEYLSLNTDYFEDENIGVRIYYETSSTYLENNFEKKLKDCFDWY